MTTINTTKAKDIFEAHENIEVLYNGKPIWIESLDTDSGKAFIKTLIQGARGRFVSVAELSEGPNHIIH